MKAPVLETLLNKVAGPDLKTLSKKDFNTVDFIGILRNL